MLEVARWVRDELATLGATACRRRLAPTAFTSTFRCRRARPYEAGLIYCQIVATVVASKHPKMATVERAVRARGTGTVYVDYLQNIEGKTLACAYSARASEYAGVSTPLTWNEIDDGVDRRTSRSAPPGTARRSRAISGRACASRRGRPVSSRLSIVMTAIGELGTRELKRGR